MFRIHKEGINFIIIIGCFFIFINILFFSFYLLFVSFFLFLFFISFFRNPNRVFVKNDNLIYAPADGKIVAIEETDENEYFNNKRIQVSIFMSIWDAHINWYPISGVVKYLKYHPGKYLVAFNPKSSTKNERNTIVIQSISGVEILLRQIAGAVARRIVCYGRIEKKIEQGEQLGFIKFGSRVDIFLPINANIQVKLNQRVKGNRTVIAILS